MAMAPPAAWRPGLALVALLCIAPPLAAEDEDPAKLLGRKSVAERLRAVELLRAHGGADAEKHLRKALGDKDWEVVHRAVEALGERGSAESLRPLLDVAAEHPVQAIRQAAATSLAALDAAGASDQLVRRLRGATLVQAGQALAWIGHASAEDTFEKLLDAKEAELQEYGLAGLAAVRGARAADLLEKHLGGRDTVLAVAALDGLVGTGDPVVLDVLLRRLVRPALTDVLERRLVRGIVALVTALPADARGTQVTRCTAALADAADAVRPRVVRLAGALGAAVPEAKEACVAALLGAATHSAMEVRSAAMAALGRLGTDAAFDACAKAARDDAAERVRFHALRALAQIGETRAVDVLAAALAQDADAGVREEAAALCGRLHRVDAAAALRAALADPDWRVVLAAAVSLGSVQDEAAIEPLAALGRHADWRIRGAAATGLGRIGRAEVIPRLIASIEDPDPTVRATVLDFLERLTHAQLPPVPRRWTEWWQQHQGSFAFVDRNRRDRDARDGRYAYGDFKNRPYAVFEDMDVFVLGAGRDRLQELLTTLTIAHRLTLPGGVEDAGLHPKAVFFANCPGEIRGSDAERLDWFVRSGGHLFATCWALTRTVAQVFPGVVHADRGEADGARVEATPVGPSAAVLEGVFEPGTRPTFQLAGYQLIVVDDPERFEVLVDTVEGDARWGEGNLAGWFSVGHGIVVQTTNHLVLQGMDGIRFPNEEARMAFALERLGYDYRELRDLKEEGAFKKDATAADACDDQSMLRLLARVVHLRRHRDG